MTIGRSIFKTSLATGVAAVFALGLFGSLGIGSVSAEAADGCQRGTCGPHIGPGGVGALVKCNGVGDTNPANTITVEAPDIYAVSVPSRPGFALVGPNNPHQWVAYKATLLRYNGTGFVKTSYPEQPWVSWSAATLEFQSWAGGIFDFWELHNNQWTRSTIGGRTPFINLAPGAYRVSIEYYWFADPERGLGDGYDVLPAERNVYVSITSPYGDVRPGYCAYDNDPGGHATWTFGG